MRSYPANTSGEPVTVLINHVATRDVVWVGAIDHVEDHRRFDNAVLNRLGKWVVADDPGEVDARLELRRRREVEPEIKPMREPAVQAEQRLVPLEFVVV